MEAVYFLTAPLVSVIKELFYFFISQVSSVGIAIICLSITLSILILPFQKLAIKLEAKISKKISLVEQDIEKLDPSLVGEQRFYKVEQIYKCHRYHPLEAIWLGSSFLVAAPILISTFLLLTSDTILAGEELYLISDLSKPDGVLWGFNFLPILLFCLTVLDARQRFTENIKARKRFYLFSATLLLLTYNLSAGLILYWITSATVAFSLHVNRG